MFHACTANIDFMENVKKFANFFELNRPGCKYPLAVHSQCNAMYSNCHYDLACIKVAVLEPKKIPQTLEVVFGKYLHAIYFIVEEGDGSGAHSSADRDKDPMDEDDDLLSEEEKEIGKNSTATLGGNSSAPTREHKSSQGGFNQQSNSNKQVTEQSDMNISTTLDRHLEPTVGLDTEHLASSPSILLNGLIVDVPEQSKYMDNQVAIHCADLPSEAWYRKQAECILDNAVDIVLDEIASQVMQEDDAEVNTRLPATPSKRVSPQTPIRRSKRREATIDEDSLERAERLVAMKNLEIPTNGKNFNNSILSISDKVIFLKLRVVSFIMQTR